MKPTLPRAAVAATIALLLAACEGGTGTQDPDFFTFRQTNGVLSGSYNPAGFTAEQVRLYLSAGCSTRGVSDYAESATDNGMVAFGGTCTTSGNFAGGTYEVERIDDIVLVKGTVTENGQVMYTMENF